MHLKSRLALIGAASVVALVLSPSTAVADGGHNLIRGDLTPSLPGDAKINNIGPGTLPWILDRGEVRIRESGRMDVRIEGLQIPAGSFDPTVDFNPVASIDALLYCDGVQMADSGPQPMTVPGGDARFRVSVPVPSMCDSPSVLISPTAAVGKAYIASLVPMGDDDDD
ncbi:MAG: hypothetical protein QOH37_1150 [Nocardioidaceae bacterium]|jgi:hypothetical protein|nr:hypothetical protein [Nocardioidaceae bacterium]